MHRNHYSCIDSVKSITQVGIRDFDQSEVEFQHQSDTTFHVFKDYDYHCQLFNGMSWSDICKDIVQTLPQHVFISMDIDGLSPSLCPQTGTPVPGGLSWNQWVYLMEQVWRSKTIIGAELVEVNSTPNNTLNDIVGAHALHCLSGMMC